MIAMKEPLWLPRGSVRALLALAVIFVSGWLMIHGKEIEETELLPLNEALFTVLAYYFAARAGAKLSQEELDRLKAERRAKGGFSPLFLPRGTIRLLMVLAFVGIAVYLVREGGWEKLTSATTLLLVFAFLLGQVVKQIVRLLRPKKDAKQGAGAFDHLKAALGLLVGAAFVGLYVSGQHATAPSAMHKAFLAFIIFYFGSR